MAALSNKFVSSFSELYVGTTDASGSADATAMEVFLTGADHDKVTLIAEIGSIANEANIIDVPEFGATYKGKLRGQLDAGQLDTVLYWAPRNTEHLALQAAAVSGATQYVTIKWIDGSNVEYVTMKTFVSSFGIDTSFDDVAKANVTFAIDGALTFVSGA